MKYCIVSWSGILTSLLLNYQCFPHYWTIPLTPQSFLVSCFFFSPHLQKNNLCKLAILNSPPCTSPILCREDNSELPMINPLVSSESSPHTQHLHSEGAIPHTLAHPLLFLLGHCSLLLLFLLWLLLLRRPLWFSVIFFFFLPLYISWCSLGISVLFFIYITL